MNIMRSEVVVSLLLLKFVFVENRMVAPYDTEGIAEQIDTSTENSDNEKANELRNYDERNRDEYGQKSTLDKVKPCAIVVLSSAQNPSVQSLLRKYRYDANGVLIPGSVKYFIKLPQGLSSTPILVPVNDKAFTPMGGFVRYYKEVPPIPHIW